MKALKKITAITQILDKNYEVLSEFIHNKEEYNSKELMINQSSYLEDGSLESKVEYEYDSNDLITREQHYLENGELGELILHEYDLDKKLIKSITRYQDSSESILTVTREPGMITLTTVDENGELEKKEVTRLDDNDNELEHTLYNYDNNIVERFEKFYNEKGELFEERYFGEDNEFLEKIIVERNSQGLPLIQKHYNDNDRLMFTVELEYDKTDERVISEKHGEDKVYLYEYNEMDLITSFKIINQANNALETQTNTSYTQEGRILEQLSTLDTTWSSQRFTLGDAVLKKEIYNYEYY